jgi:hypothetical protein
LIAPQFPLPPDGGGFSVFHDRPPRR